MRVNNPVELFAVFGTLAKYEEWVGQGKRCEYGKNDEYVAPEPDFRESAPEAG